MKPSTATRVIADCIHHGHHPMIAWDVDRPAIIWRPPLPEGIAAILAGLDEAALIAAAFDVEERGAIQAEQ